MESANNKYDVRDCPVCYDPFPQNSNVTLLKPCLHVMCNECWTNLFWHTAAAQKAASIPIAKCPACMQPVEKPKDIHFRNDTQHVDLTAPPTPTIVPAPTTNRDVSPLNLPPVMMTLAEFNTVFPVALPTASVTTDPTYQLASGPAQTPPTVPRVAVAIPRPRPYNGPRRATARASRSHARHRRREERSRTLLRPIPHQITELRVNRLLRGGETDLMQLQNLTITTPGQASLVSEISQSITDSINRDLDALLGLDSI